MKARENICVGSSRVPAKAVKAFADRLERERCLLHGFAMVDNGKMVAEEYWAPFHKDSLHRMYSVGKSFTSLAIGLLEEEGKLSLDDCVCDYFTDKCPKEEMHPWVKLLTIRQMLTMTTCHAKTTYKLFEGDWVESFFRVQPTNLPGAVFAYDTSSTHVLSALVERLSGEKMLDYLRRKAFDRIGFSREAYYMPDPAGVSQGGSGLNCRLRDLLAVAQLVLDEGEFEGEQLLPRDYLKEATSFQISTLQQPAYDEQLGYGYQIWRGRNNCFYFYGIGGQLAICLPQERFILVTMGNTLENKNGIKDIFDAFFEEIYPYLTVAPESVREQMSRDRESDCGEGRSLPEIPVVEVADSECFCNGKCYDFDENMLELSKLQVCMEGNEGKLYMKKENKDFELSFGFEDYVKGTFPWSGAECYCQGAWVMEDMLFIRCYIMGPDMANLYICLRFGEESVTVKLTKGADDAMKNFEGVASSRC